MILEIKEKYPRIALSRICRLLGVSRQGYYQHFWRQECVSVEEELVVQEVLRLRIHHRHMGGRKLYEKLQSFFLTHQIKMGRDALFDLLSAHNLLVRRKKRSIRTTQSSHWLRKYPNLIRGYIPEEINKLWVCDITYWKTQGGLIYLSFITDAYSHKIVGYHAAQSLEALETIQALEMALSVPDQDLGSLIHHSDRGVQYCSSVYVGLLNKYGVKISMTENGDPYENAIAERVNGILKNEYLCESQSHSLSESKQNLEKAVILYNQERPHQSLGYLTPENVHKNNLKVENLWKKKI